MTKVYHRTASKDAGSRDDWCTPECVLERVRAVGTIALDPCTSSLNPAGATYALTADDDGLQAKWLLEGGGTGLVYVNPPYSQMKAWAAKIAEESARCEIVSLIAARPDSRWFDELVWQTAGAVCFWKGRLRFVGAEHSAPFPSAVVYHGPRVRRFERAFADVGRVIRL